MKVLLGGLLVWFLLVGSQDYGDLHKLIIMRPFISRKHMDIYRHKLCWQKLPSQSKFQNVPFLDKLQNAKSVLNL